MIQCIHSDTQYEDMILNRTNEVLSHQFDYLKNFRCLIKLFTIFFREKLVPFDESVEILKSIDGPEAGDILIILSTCIGLCDSPEKAAE
jgi:hypothetical protein